MPTLARQALDNAVKKVKETRRFMRTEVGQTFKGLLDYVEGANYAGYDPYDALNSPLIRLLGSRSKWVRIAFTQFLRRCPVNLRPLLGVKKGHNPKGIGLFLWGYVRLFRMDEDEAVLEKIRDLLDILNGLRSANCSGSAWGYNFDWQSRTFFRPRGAPTIVNTAFIGHALLDCYEYTGLQQALDMAIPIKEFILNDLHRTRKDETFCFSYTPVDTDVVHNANMLGSSILSRLFRYSADPACREAGQTSLAYSMDHQNEDGSWPYAENRSQRWIDSFHTGFNLQALRCILAEGMVPEYRQAYEKGVSYYARNFFLADGTPKYYHDTVYPIDIHAPAEAIYFFSGMGQPYEALTEKVLHWTLANMLSSRGYFYFRNTGYFMNRIPYMRWSQAWMFHSLSEYMIHADEYRACDPSERQQRRCRR